MIVNKSRLGCDQPPFIVAGPFDQPVDGRGNQGIVEIKFCFDHISFRRFQRRLGCEFFGHRVVQIFLADGLLGQERLHPIEVLMGLDEPGFGLGDPRLGADIGRFERHWIDLIERVSFMDVTAFGVKPLLHGPGHLRTNLDNAGRLRLSDELRFIRHGLVGRFYDLNLRNGAWGSRGGLLLATEQAGQVRSGARCLS